MKSNKFIIIAVAFILLAFITGYVYHRGSRRHPFRYNLDLTTLVEWTNDLSKYDKDHPVIEFESTGPYDFTNENDVGLRDDMRWSKKEDEFFIVYYSTATEPKTGSYRANNCLEIANSAIGDLSNVMGRYYFPDDEEVMDHRKLCIYLPDTPEEYSWIINELYGSSVSVGSSIGMTIVTVTQCGAVIKGIVIHPSCFAPDVYVMNDYRTTLRHEMSHYVYFMSLDYGSALKHPLWVSEGIADFIGRESPQVAGADSIQFIAGNCNLAENFPENSSMPNSAYWAGESFYRFLSDSLGTKAPTAFLETLYKSPVTEALNALFEGTDPKERWVESLRQNDTLRHPEYLNSENNGLKR